MVRISELSITSRGERARVACKSVFTTAAFLHAQYHGTIMFTHVQIHPRAMRRGCLFFFEG